MKDRPTIVLFSFLIALLLAACQAATTEDSATPEPQSAAQQEPAPMKPTPEDLLRNGVLVEEGVPHYPRTAGQASGADPRVVLRAVKDFWSLRLRLWASKDTALQRGDAVLPGPAEA